MHAKHDVENKIAKWVDYAHVEVHTVPCRPLVVYGVNYAHVDFVASRKAYDYPSCYMRATNYEQIPVCMSRP